MRVIVSTVVHKSAESLFWLSQNYERRLEWDVYLSEACLLNHHMEAEVGVESFCKNKSGSSLTSRYIAFSPPTHATVVMTRGPWLLKTFAGTWRFRETLPGDTEVRFLYNFKCRPSILCWLIEPIVAFIYRRDMRRRLRAFKQWSEAEMQ